MPTTFKPYLERKASSSVDFPIQSESGTKINSAMPIELACSEKDCARISARSRLYSWQNAFKLSSGLLLSINKMSFSRTSEEPSAAINIGRKRFQRSIANTFKPNLERKCNSSRFLPISGEPFLTTKRCVRCCKPYSWIKSLMERLSMLLVSFSLSDFNQWRATSI